MSSIASAATPSTASQDLQTLLSALKADVVSAAGGLLDGFFNNIIATPTPQNVVAQGGILFASALLAGPALEAPLITQIATTGKALVAAAQSSVVG